MSVSRPAPVGRSVGKLLWKTLTNSIRLSKSRHSITWYNCCVNILTQKYFLREYRGEVLLYPDFPRGGRCAGTAWTAHFFIQHKRYGRFHCVEYTQRSFCFPKPCKAVRNHNPFVLLVQLCWDKFINVCDKQLVVLFFVLRKIQFKLFNDSSVFLFAVVHRHAPFSIRRPRPPILPWCWTVAILTPWRTPLLPCSYRWVWQRSGLSAPAFLHPAFWPAFLPAAFAPVSGGVAARWLISRCRAE